MARRRFVTLGVSTEASLAGKPHAAASFRRGVAMGCPSETAVPLVIRAGALGSVGIGGSAVVSEGMALV